MRVIWFGASLLSCREKDYIFLPPLLPEDGERSSGIKILWAGLGPNNQKVEGKGRTADFRATTLKSVSCLFLTPHFIETGFIQWELLRQRGRFPVGSLFKLIHKGSFWLWRKVQMSINTFVYQGVFSLSCGFGFYLLLAGLLTSSVSVHFGAAVNRSVVWPWGARFPRRSLIFCCRAGNHINARSFLLPAPLLFLDVA